MAKATKQDATIRNVRASQRRDDALAARVAALEVEVGELTRRVDALENEVSELRRGVGVADRRESQGAEQRCECGGVQRITPTFSPWEFNYRCEGCGRAGTISWAHASPAPVFVPEGDGRQGSLFS